MNLQESRRLSDPNATGLLYWAVLSGQCRGK